MSMELTEERSPFGGFTTEIKDGKFAEWGKYRHEHIPSGKCIAWAHKNWNLLDIHEKLIATVPGKLRPVKYLS
jgi:hypothetical protein